LKLGIAGLFGEKGGTEKDLIELASSSELRGEGNRGRGEEGCENMMAIGLKHSAGNLSHNYGQKQERVEAYVLRFAAC